MGPDKFSGKEVYSGLQVHNLDAIIKGYKARRVAKGFTRAYCIDYLETPLVAKLIQ